jgi:hypothetical protein
VSFVSELREELVAAAEREQARRLPRIELPVRQTLLAAAAAAAVALIVVIAAGSLSTKPDEDGPVVAEPTPGTVRELFGGELTPDVRYQTRVFRPTLSFIVADDEWRAAVTDRPETLLLEHGEGWFEPDGERRLPPALTFTYVREVYDPAVRGLRASLTTAPLDLYGWLRDHPDLRVGPPRPVTVGHVPGERFSVEVRFDRPTHPDPECRRRLQVTCTALGPGGSLQDGTLLQMTILRTDPDPLVIIVDHFTRAGLRKMEEAAAPVLESLRIG